MTDRVACAAVGITMTSICPKCGRKGQWRTGVHFDHQMICGECHEVWEPGNVSEAHSRRAAAFLDGKNHSDKAIAATIAQRNEVDSTVGAAIVPEVFADTPLPAGPCPTSYFDDYGMYIVPEKFDADVVQGPWMPIPDPASTRRVSNFVPKWARGGNETLGDMPFTGSPPPPEPLRIYFAASFHRQAEIRGYRDGLLGLLNKQPTSMTRTFESTSAWLDEGTQDGSESHAPALSDPAGPAHRGSCMWGCIEAVRSADVVICFTEKQGTLSRGGRHVEYGAALALGTPIVIVGPIETDSYAIPFGDGVPDHVVDRFRVVDRWDADRVAVGIIGDLMEAGKLAAVTR